MRTKKERIYDALSMWMDREDEMSMRYNEQYEIIENAKKALQHFDNERETAIRRRKKLQVLRDRLK